MKKNWTTRVGVLMLALTLITSCFVGGTFAKYTTSDSGSDTARVAKFGVTVTGEGTTFAKTYEADDKTYTDGVTVSATEDVVAPGTKGEMAAFTITGTPEVAVRVTYEATKFDLGDKWEDEDGVYYCPLAIKVGETTLKGTDSKYTSVDDFENAVKAAIKAYSKDIAPNVDLSVAETNPALSVSWAWDFEGNDDVKDTFLGDQAAANSAATISLKVTATVTQID